jgi:hypothetical protein
MPPDALLALQDFPLGSLGGQTIEIYRTSSGTARHLDKSCHFARTIASSALFSARF